YTPFTSALDWHVAKWAVEEGINLERYTDKLVQTKEKLGLSFHNSRTMMKMVDKIPDRCGKWSTKRLRFKDSPNEWYTIQYRDPIEVIKGLWGDPAFSHLLEFKPKKLF
ncbi:hypothetical protein K435DRAFT_583957, partial [Dendrothele bispora CBS 962.96]